MGNFIDRTGEKHGKLKIIGFRYKTQANGRRYIVWDCQCDCGNTTTVLYGNLKKGLTTSCGCYHKDVTSKMMTKHGKCYSPEHAVWRAMKQRCYDKGRPEYINYGGRGIKVCDKWLHSFQDFYNDMGSRPSDKHSIDRINNDGDYEPSNCRWATQKEQALNTRANVRHYYNGEHLTVPELAEKYGIARFLLALRLSRGFKVDEAIEVPAGEFCRHFDYKGESLTIRQLSKKYGVKFQTLRHRIDRGWTIQSAMEIKDGRKETPVYRESAMSEADFR